MKKILAYTVIAAFLTGFAACDTNIREYDYNHDGLNFKDSLINFSFAYSEPGTTEDIIWLEVTTQGFVPYYARKVEFLQVKIADEKNAEQGKHYIDFENFDNDFIAENYVIPAKKAETKIPLKVLRHESLENEVVTLKICVKPDGEYFGIGLVPRSTITITITDMLTKPKHWVGVTSPLYGELYFGAYSPEKHRWLIESTGEKWDAEYLYDVIGFDEEETNSLNENFDRGFYEYLVSKFRAKLAEDNERLISEGKDPYDFAI